MDGRLGLQTGHSEGMGVQLVVLMLFAGTHELLTDDLCVGVWAVVDSWVPWFVGGCSQDGWASS